ncbi:hypothetical protein BR93DRAFT_937435 [Coniochaeta sp. PMI_546]|nr:hypothetical protein BR93DRAFT_937435 [Coniochaeta sp. PMI_546]
MSSPESPPACNFPEILARDLEVSEATFLAKSMTAGTPIRSLATPKRQPLYPVIDKQDPHVHWEDTPSKECGLGVIDEDSYRSDSPDNGTPSEVASLTSDSGSDSGMDIEPPSVRMRRQSVCTTATSVMAHCLPAKEQPGYSLVALEDSYQGQSWINLDMEDSDDDDDEPGEAQTARPGPPTKHNPECVVPHRKDAVHTFPSSSGSEKLSHRQGNDLSPAHSPPLNHLSAAIPPTSIPCQRPHTASGVPSQDKPRLVEIARSLPLHKRSFSHDPSSRLISRSLFEFQPGPSHCRNSTSSTLASEASGFQHEILRAEIFPATPLSKSRQYQATMSGRKVVDATPGRVSSGIDVADDDEQTQDENVSNHDARVPHDDEHPTAEMSQDSNIEANEHMSQVKIPTPLLEEILSSPAQPVSSQGPQESPVDEQTYESSDDSSVGETWFRSKVALPMTHISSPSNAAITSQSRVSVRIPPHIFEQLSNSTTSFVEMPLSPKSLTLDMIRSCAKKLKMKFNRSSLATALDEPDVAPAPPPHKWKLSSLRKKDNPPPAPTAPTPSSLAQASPEATAMLKIFPRASKHTCESLYAYLVAYNYITLLCGEDDFFKAVASSSVATAISTVSRITKKTPRLVHHGTTNDDASSTGIPGKALTLLGMDATSTSTSTTPGPSAPKLSKMRSFFKKGKEAGEMVVQQEDEPAESAASSSVANTKARPARVVTEAEVKKLQGGLLQCVRNLVAKARAGSNPAAAGTLQTDDFEVDLEGWKTLDPYLLRSLCEVVSAEEDRLASSTT